MFDKTVIFSSEIIKMVKNRLAELQNGSSRNAIEDRESAEMKVRTRELQVDRNLPFCFVSLVFNRINKVE